ncbi:MAG: hypothetical protein ACK417_11800 [Bacteroidia bacterium]
MMDHISVNDSFWIQIKSHLVSFGFKGLPKDVHFTISFNKKSNDWNIHITKNVGTSKDKPQIKIVVIDQILLQELTSSIMFTILNVIFRPINIIAIKEQHQNNIGFILLHILQSSEFSAFTEQSLIESFKHLSRIKKKSRFKIEGDIQAGLENFADSQFIAQLLLDSIVDFPDNDDLNIDSGLLLTGSQTLYVFRIFGKWFEMRDDIVLIDFLNALVGSELAKHILWKTKRAIVAIKFAKNYSDTAHLNNPIRLIGK